MSEGWRHTLERRHMRCLTGVVVMALSAHLLGLPPMRILQVQQHTLNGSLGEHREHFA